MITDDMMSERIALSEALDEVLEEINPCIDVVVNDLLQRLAELAIDFQIELDLVVGLGQMIKKLKSEDEVERAGGVQ